MVTQAMNMFLTALIYSLKVDAVYEIMHGYDNSSSAVLNDSSDNQSGSTGRALTSYSRGENTLSFFSDNYCHVNKNNLSVYL